MIKFRNLLEETKIGNKTFDDMELCPGAIKAFKKDYETRDNKDEVLAAAQAVDDYLAIERKGFNGKVDESDLEKMKGMVDVAKKKIADAGLSADDHDYHQGHIDKVTSLVKKANMEEKTLTPAEIKKRDEIAKAMKKDDPDMPMDKKMAIATATAKRVAEKKTVRQLINPKKEVMVVKMVDKQHKVIVIDKSKEKEYLSKGWTLAETYLSEDGHTDVESMKNKVKIAVSALQKMQTELSKLQDGDSLPSWWTNKVAVAVDKLDGMADYLDTQVEEVELDENIKNQISQLQKMLKDLERGKKTPGKGFAKIKIKELIADLEKRQTQEEVELEESDAAKLYSLYNKAMKMMPGSPAQKKVSAEIEKLRKKLGMDESLNETVSAALHIKGMRTATAHAKKDGANLKDKDLMNKYFIYHMKKNNRMTHFKKDRDGNLDFNSIGDGTKIEPKHYKDIFNKTKKESLEEAVSPAQQAAIAISKKERGEKPKNESVGEVLLALNFAMFGAVALSFVTAVGMELGVIKGSESELKTAKNDIARLKRKIQKNKQYKLDSIDKEKLNNALKIVRNAKPTAFQKLKTKLKDLVKKNKTVKESRAAADARRAMKSRGATKGMALTKKDKDTEATDDDRKAASKNIIMQLRKAADLPTGAEVDFNRGKGKVSRDQAKAALARFDALSKPNEKERFQKSIRSLADIKKILGR